MLETLAGRLKWERTGDGIRVVIPVRVDWFSAMTGISLWMLPYSTLWVVTQFIHLSTRTSLALSSIAVWIGACLVILWYTMIFTIKHVLTLNPAEMTIQMRFFGIRVRQRTIATSRFHNLRYAASEYGDWASLNSMRRIEIDRDSKTRKFAFGITEKEADALIEKMMEVYNFPKYPQADSAPAVTAER
ncbi:MAG: hypothetical protein ABSC48_01470 [Terracidiphilus sp.]